MCTNENMILTGDRLVTYDKGVRPDTFLLYGKVSMHRIPSLF